MHIKNKPPIFVPQHHRHEMEKFSKAMLMDMVWDFACRHSITDEESTMGTIREVAEVIAIHRAEAGR